MDLPLPLADKIRMLLTGQKIPAGKMKHPLIQELIAEGIIHRVGKMKGTLQIADPQQLTYFLANHCAINDLEVYIETLKKSDLSRQELVYATTDSKFKPIRTFKGFLVNCYSSINAVLNGSPYILSPVAGTSIFIYDYENFIPDSDITIIGIENPENFRHIEKQQYLFHGLNPLFVSRYPQNQSKDLLNWLQRITNKYLHFGDFDLAGIGIYLNEYKRHLTSRATFFIPENIDALISRFGSKKRYDLQKINFDYTALEEEYLLRLINLIHLHRKGLDQEILIHFP